MLVLIPELVWPPDRVGDCQDFTRPGESMTVKILRFVPEEGCYVASAKQVRPAEDPWADPARFKLGSQWRGAFAVRLDTGTGEGQGGGLIEIQPGVVGYLPAEQCGELAVDDEVSVEVVALDIAKERIGLRRIGHRSGGELQRSTQACWGCRGIEKDKLTEQLMRTFG